MTGSKHRPPAAYEIPKLMDELIQWIRKNSKKLHPVELASITLVILKNHRCPFFPNPVRFRKSISIFFDQVDKS